MIISPLLPLLLARRSGGLSSSSFKKSSRSQNVNKPEKRTSAPAPLRTPYLSVYAAEDLRFIFGPETGVRISHVESTFPSVVAYNPKLKSKKSIEKMITSEKYALGAYMIMELNFELGIGQQLIVNKLYVHGLVEMRSGDEYMYQLKYRVDAYPVALFDHESIQASHRQ